MVHKLDPKRSKLASQTYEFVFIVYAVNSKTYKFYNLKDQVIIKWNDADIFEDKFPFKLRNSGGFSGGLASSSEPLCAWWWWVRTKKKKSKELEPLKTLDVIFMLIKKILILFKKILVPLMLTYGRKPL